MRFLKKALGLVVDDARLVGVLALFLLAAFLLHVAGQPLLAAVAIWLGLIVSLTVSVSHELRLKKKTMNV